MFTSTLSSFFDNFKTLPENNKDNNNNNNNNNNGNIEYSDIQNNLIKCEINKNNYEKKMKKINKDLKKKKRENMKLKVKLDSLKMDLKYSEKEKEQTLINLDKRYIQKLKNKNKKIKKNILKIVKRGIFIRCCNFRK